MKYELNNGKTISIPDKEIQKFMNNLELSKDEAIEMWLADNDYSENDEQEELDSKAKKVKINHGASADKPKEKAQKPKTVKVSDAKKELFSKLSQFLNDFCEENDTNCTILKENKLIELQFGGEIFKIDLIQQRKKK